MVKGVAKKIDKVVVRVLSLGRYFKPKKVSIDLHNESLQQVAARLRAEDTAALAAYGKAVDPTFVLKLYSKAKQRLRNILARLKARIKAAV